jgi:F0F1-type ATP synthase assembly protein I
MEKKSSSTISKFARFSSVGIQMGVLIALFSWLGTYLDKKFLSKTPWWTIGLSLFGVFASLYLVIKEVINLNKEDEQK